MKMGLDKTAIIEIAVKIADERGIGNVTLKALADEAGIKTPSLYKHIGGLEELHKELMLHGWYLLENEVTKAAVGKAKNDAIMAMGYAYRDFVSQHKGLFEAMQWYNMYQSEEHEKATEGTVFVLFQVLDAYNLAEEEKIHIVRMLRGFLQGFLTIECHGGFGNPLPSSESFDFALRTILNGISGLQEGKTKRTRE